MNESLPKGFECRSKQETDFKEPAMPLEVGQELLQFLLGKYGQYVDSATVLEGLLLTMQMIGGPKRAATVIRYCAVTVLDK